MTDFDIREDRKRDVGGGRADLDLGDRFAELVDGDEIDIDEFQRTSNSLRRLCESIGLERRARDVTPDLQTYLAQKVAKTARDEGEEAEQA